MMFCWCALALLTLVPVVTGNDAGVEVTLTHRGLDYAVSTNFRKMLFKMEIPDLEGTKCGVQYGAKGLKIYYMDNFEIVQMFYPGTGVKIEVKDANIYISGNKTLGMFRNTFNVNITISISAFVAVETGQPTFSMKECTPEVHLNDLQDRVSLISCFSGMLSRIIQRKICPQLENILVDLNTYLATMNATISEYAEVDYSLRSVSISDTSIELGFKGLFYNTQQRKEPPFSPIAVSLAFDNTKMFYIVISAFTINSAFLVFHDAGIFNINITDDMIPSVSPIRLSTMTFGAFIPEISEKYPDLKLELNVKTVKEPAIKFEPNNVILQLFSTVTAVQSNTMTQLFVLNLASTASVQVSVAKDKLALALTLEKIDVRMNTQTFKFTNLNFLNMSIKYILFPIIKAHLAKSFPLPGFFGSTIGNVQFVNPQVVVLKDCVLIGTDILFTENTSS